MEEIWKDIPSYEGYYQVSNLGNLKSLARVVDGPKGLKKLSERILKQRLGKTGYLYCDLNKNGKSKTVKPHQLVVICFLNHTPNGYHLVVNHINFIKTDNRLENLEIVTTRENTNKKHIISSSKYIGVCWCKHNKKWLSQIHINGKRKFIGYFKCELQASEAYQNELKKITLWEQQKRYLQD
jgi:hypothetical protein